MLAKFYQQIQVIMTLLGFYDGQCNGVWGPKSIAAMRKWEMTDEFEPAVPLNGKPFLGRGRLPEGFEYGPGPSILCDLLYSDKAIELLKTPLLSAADVATQCGGAESCAAQQQEAAPAYVHRPVETAPTPVYKEPEPAVDPAPAIDVPEPELDEEDKEDIPDIEEGPIVEAPVNAPRGKDNKPDWHIKRK